MICGKCGKAIGRFEPWHTIQTAVYATDEDGRPVRLEERRPAMTYCHPCGFEVLRATRKEPA